jgi:hypothetical protein
MGEPVNKNNNNIITSILPTANPGTNASRVQQILVQLAKQTAQTAK